ncbi:MAG TPA: zinc ribbon domain-containing protein [Acidimicrobiia bacterium]|nr:zinc ribbon domain-containing protein [Acidimicrobiia bacterium]
MTKPRSRPRPVTPSDKVISVSSDGPSRGSEPPYEEFSLGERPPTERPTATEREQAPTQRGGNGNGNGNGSSREVSCPSCGAINPGNNRHCQECGARLRQGPLPTAPRPAVQATAGVRAAVAISALLLGVILFALFFNIFTGDDPEALASTTTTTSAAIPLPDPAPIEILDETCNPEGIGSLICANLTSGQFGQGNEYQVNWEENVGTGITIRLTFVEPMAITSIQWTNIEDATRFRQNYRAESLSIEAEDSVGGAVPVLLQDQPGTQLVQYAALSTTWLEIVVNDAYQAVPVEDNVFAEIAIDEIVVVGRPVASTGTTAPADGGSTTTSPSTTVAP